MAPWNFLNFSIMLLASAYVLRLFFFLFSIFRFLVSMALPATPAIDVCLFFYIFCFFFSLLLSLSAVSFFICFPNHSLSFSLTDSLTLYFCYSWQKNYARTMAHLYHFSEFNVFDEKNAGPFWKENALKYGEMRWEVNRRPKFRLWGREGKFYTHIFIQSCWAYIIY